jgi:hypothetical protein
MQRKARCKTRICSASTVKVVTVQTDMREVLAGYNKKVLQEKYNKVRVQCRP